MNIAAAYGNRPIKVYTDNEFSQYLEWKKASEMRSPHVTITPGAGALNALSYLSATAEIAVRFDDLKSKILRGKIIQPGEVHGGLIMLQKLSEADIGKPLVMILKVGKEFHEIRFSIIKDM